LAGGATRRQASPNSTSGKTFDILFGEGEFVLEKRGFAPLRLPGEREKSPFFKGGN
jgi:hypothetical protein